VTIFKPASSKYCSFKKKIIKYSDWLQIKIVSAGIYGWPQKPFVQALPSEIFTTGLTNYV